RDGGLCLRGGLRAPRLRSWRRDLAPDARHRRCDERRLRPQDAANRRGRMTHRTLRRAGWNVLGLAVFAVMVFPVFWMVSSAFKPTDELNSVTPTWFSGSPTLGHFRAVLHRAYFWTDVKNSLIVVAVTVAIAVVLAFL